MKKGVNKTAMLALGALLVGTFAAQAQDSDQFIGETVHLLPPAAAAHNPHAQPSDGHSTDAKVTFTPTNHAALTDHGGAVMSNAGVKNIFWNSSVANAAGTQGYATMQSQMNAFLNSFSGSQDYTIIGQYSKSGNPIATTIRNMGTYVDSQATASSISDSSIKSYISSGLSANKFGTTDSDVIYSVYFPSGMQVRSGSSKSCTSFCGYHGSFTWNGKTIKYAVYPWPCSNGCTTTGKGAGDMWTIVTSHEIREAVTDPVNAWWDGTTGYEADDKCAWQSLHQLAGTVFWVQPEFSNADGNKCVYFN